MPRFHHVNLGVLADDVDAEARFLVEILDYRKVEDGLPPGVGARWYEADDGSQVHLSVDPEHRPPARAHVAVAYGDGLAEVEDRLARAGVAFRRVSMEGFPAVSTCRDPAGNLWELRGS